MGVGDEPYALFFKLLKAKQQQETMNTLLLDDNSIIKDKEAILQEVTRFYGALFQSAGKNTEVLVARRNIPQFTIVRVIAKQQAEIERFPKVMS